MIAQPWSDDVRKLLEAVVRSDTDQRYGGQRWAAFDFDNTIIDGDISEAILGYASTTGVFSRSTDSIAYYRKLCAASTINGIKYGEYGGTAFILQMLEGFTLAGVTDLAAQVSGRIIDGFVDDCPDTYAGFPSPALRRPVVELIGRLIEHGLRIRIISAGIIWPVRWYVHNLVNPLLAEIFGENIQIDLADVCAIGAVMADTRDENPTTDRMLISNDAYLRCDRPEADRFRVTRIPDGPMSFAHGKSAAAWERFGQCNPALMVGDSGGDLALWAAATHRLWLRREADQANRLLAAHMPRPYAVQSVG